MGQRPCIRAAHARQKVHSKLQMKAPGASAGKQEFFHKRSFQGVSIDEFVTLLDECMVWYRDKRIKLEYGMSIMDKRIGLGLVA